MSFQLLAVKVLEGCSPKIKKCLQEDELYLFSTLYKQDPDSELNLLRSDNRLSENKAYDTLYNVRKRSDNDKEDLNVTVSAIVGMNGDGKSSCVELVIRILNNFACRFGFINDQDSLSKIEGLCAILYYLVDSDIYCILCKDNNVDWYKNGKKVFKEDSILYVSDEDMKKKLIEHSDSLFYSMIINYSLYAYNSTLLKEENLNKNGISWIDGLFYKNDSYQTPVVINPKRTEGNIDINREEYLTRQRLISLFVTSDSENEGRNISDNEEAIGFAFSVDNDTKFISKTISKYFEEVKGDECIWGDMKPYSEIDYNIHENLMECFKKFWKGFIKDYNKNIKLFEIASKKNKENGNVIQTDLSRYLSLIDRYTNTVNSEFDTVLESIDLFYGPKQVYNFNYKQFYRLLVIIIVWDCLKSIKGWKFMKNKELDIVLDNPDNTENACILYILYKVISIMETYKGICNTRYLYDDSFMVFEREWPNETIKESIKNNLESILKTDDYRTLKLWQTVNYLKRKDKCSPYDAKYCDFKGIRDSYRYYISFDKLAKINYGKTGSELIRFLPAPVFKGDIVIHVNDTDFVKKDGDINKEDEFYTVNTLSSGMLQRLNSVGTFIYHLRNIDNQQKGDLLIDYSNVAVIFEEVELYFHPEYQKSYLNYLLKQLERAHLKKLRNLNIILVTHSPFVLSDVVSENILCLNNGSQEKNVSFKTFGANIHDLLRLSFFMRKGFIGEYVQATINKIIVLLHVYDFANIKNIKELNKDEFISENTKLKPYISFLFSDSNTVNIDSVKSKYPEDYIYDMISLLDEPLIKNSLLNEYYRVFNSDEIKSRRIKLLEQELERLKHGNV